MHIINKLLNRVIKTLKNSQRKQWNKDKNYHRFFFRTYRRQQNKIVKVQQGKNKTIWYAKRVNTASSRLLSLERLH